MGTVYQNIPETKALNCLALTDKQKEYVKIVFLEQKKRTAFQKLRAADV